MHVPLVHLENVHEGSCHIFPHKPPHPVHKHVPSQLTGSAELMSLMCALHVQTAPASTLALQASSGLLGQSSKDSLPEYHLSTVNVPPAWRFGTGRRLPITTSDSPGPGEYFA